MSAIERFRGAVDRVLRLALALLLMALVLVVGINVVARDVAGYSITEMQGLAQFFLMWLALLGTAFVVGEKAHLSIDLLSTFLPGRSIKLIDRIKDVIIVTFACYVMIYGGSLYALKTIATGEVSSILQIKIGYVYLCLPIAGLLCVFYTLMNLATHKEYPRPCDD